MKRILSILLSTLIVAGFIASVHYNLIGYVVIAGLAIGLILLIANFIYGFIKDNETTTTNQ